MKTTTVKIEIPIPDSRLSSQQGRSKWLRQKATKEQRSLGYLKGKQVVGELKDLPWNPAAIVYTFYWPDNRRRDETNYMQMLKGAVDGLVDAGLIAGDEWQRLNNRGAISEIDRENPRVELLISKVEA